MKKNVVLLVVLLLGIAGVFAYMGLSKKDDTDKVYTLKVGMVVTENDPMYKGAVRLKEKVEERTDGKLKIEVYPSSQLGDSPEILEQAKTGANVAVIVDPARLADFVPEIGIFGAPYIVDSFQEGDRFTHTELFKGWERELATKHGVQILSFNWYQGDRHLLTKKAIKTPEDLKGLRMRTPGAAVTLETIKALGAEPTALAWSEVYPGLQQKVIDAAEAQYPAVYGAHLYEVITHVTKTGHFQLITGLVTGSTWFNSLPEEYQEILLEESANAGNYASQLTIDGLHDYEAKMADEGVTIQEVDITPFKAATDTVYDKLPGYRELKEKVDQALGK